MMNNRLLDDDDDESLLTTTSSKPQQQQATTFGKSTTTNIKKNTNSSNNYDKSLIQKDQKHTTSPQIGRSKWLNLKKDHKSHALCWIMILGAGLLLTAIGIVSMVLLVIYSPTPK